MDNLIYLSDIKADGALVDSVVLRWKSENYTYVKKDDLLMEVSMSTGKKYEVTTPRSGFLVRIIYNNIKIEQYRGGVDIQNAKNVAIAGLFDSYEDYIEKCYKNKAKVEIDEFTNQLTIKWEVLAKPLFKIHFSEDSRYLKDIAFSKNTSGKSQMPLNDSLTRTMAFSFVFEDGKGSIMFSYDSKKIKLKKNDTVSFIFENGDIADFVIMMNPYQVAYNGDYRQFKCQLYNEDINLLVKERISKWRISFCDSGKSPITNCIDSIPLFDIQILNDSSIAYLAKALPYLIQKYTNDYVKILHKKNPLYEFPKKYQSQNSVFDYSEAFDWCYVYLMKDLTNGYYKIGISNNPEYREHTLQSEKPSIEMLGCKKFPSRKIAEAFEKALHQAYYNQHIRGEWFSLSGFDVAIILESFK